MKRRKSASLRGVPGLEGAVLAGVLAPVAVVGLPVAMPGWFVAVLVGLGTVSVGLFALALWWLLRRRGQRGRQRGR
jgi:hypothetical protein